MSSGNHAYAIRARPLDSGSVTFGQQFITAQGIPASYPSAKFVDANTTTLTGTWQKITSDVPFSAATDVDVYLQGYFQLNSGTPGQKISVGFSLDDASSTRTSDLAVPPYFRDGVNIFDHLIRVPAGTHTLSLWAVNRDGGSTQIQYRQLEFVAFPSSTPIVDGIATSTQLVDSQNTETQPTGILLNAACGKWTKLLEYQLSPLTGDFNWTGEGFVELLGRQSGGDWASARGEIAVQVLTGTGAEVDIHFVQFSIPAGRGQLYFFQDAMIWGNQDGNTVRLWIRKEVGCGGGHGSFNVGKRYLSTKLVADNSSCYYN